MGTSSSYRGPGRRTPLVPSWLPSPGAAPAPVDGGLPAPAPPPLAPPVPPPPIRIAIPAVAAANRFMAARNSFSRFARSGGSDRANLGRAISNYVSTASGGARTAAARMGASRQSGAQLLNFLSGAAGGNAVAALRSLRLETLAGHPIEEVFVGLADYVCPDGGTIDEGIAREAFVETIADLAENGISDLNALTLDQMQTIFEIFATHAIETRLYNDIGSKAIILPAGLQDAALVQEQLQDFIRRGVADALTSARAGLQALSPTSVRGFIDRVYEQAFGILKALGEAEADAT